MVEGYHNHRSRNRTVATALLLLLSVVQVRPSNPQRGEHQIVNYDVTILASWERRDFVMQNIVKLFRNNVFVVEATNASAIDVMRLRDGGMVLMPWRNSENVLQTVYGVQLPTARVIACMYSHRRAMEHIVLDKLTTSPGGATLVLEDDAQPLTSNYHLDIVRILRTLPPDWDFVQVGKCWDIWCDKRQPTEDVYEASMGYELCTHSYLVSRKGAERILQFTFPIVLPIVGELAI